MAYQIKLEVFEGPFDLLFHLIEKNEVDIYDIPIAEITQQYLDYIEAMQMLDLEVASEFLVMAAQLLAIKARMLLPRAPRSDDEDAATAYEEDPREELVEKLLEYRKYKLAAAFLKEKEELMAQVYTRPENPELLTRFYREENPLEGISLDSVLEALKQVLQRAVERETVQEIPRDKVSMRQKMKEILGRVMLSRQGVSFADLFRSGATKVEIVVTFLALLELIRVGRVSAYQTKIFGDIIIYPVFPAQA